MNKLKIGDWIKCSDIDDLGKHLDELSEAGYGAVADVYTLQIRITSVPEDHETH